MGVGRVNCVCCTLDSLLLLDHLAAYVGFQVHNTTSTKTKALLPNSSGMSIRSAGSSGSSWRTSCTGGMPSYPIWRSVRQATLRRFYNFIVRPDGPDVLIDFDHPKPWVLTLESSLDRLLLVGALSLIRYLYRAPPTSTQCTPRPHLRCFYSPSISSDPQQRAIPVLNDAYAVQDGNICPSGVGVGLIILAVC